MIVLTTIIVYLTKCLFSEKQPNETIIIMLPLIIAELLALDFPLYDLIKELNK